MGRVYGSNALEAYEEERASVRYRRMRQEQMMQEQQRREEERQIEQQRAQQRRRKAKQQKAKLDLISIFCMVATLVTVGYICVSYLRVQESITVRTKEIAGKESELAELKTENDIEYNRVEADVDLKQIYKIATKQLGMVHADKENVIPYSEIKSDFVKQYGEIPD